MGSGNINDIRSNLGLVQVYTGNGKGKTTAALGLSMRAVGNGLSVAIVQFMKSSSVNGEYKVAKSLKGLVILPMGRSSFVGPGGPKKEDIEAADNAFRKATELIGSKTYDIVILDEINVAMFMHLVKIQDVIKMVKGRPEHVEMILTGRYAPQEMIDMADLVTEMRCIKHPYDRDILARDGIER